MSNLFEQLLSYANSFETDENIVPQQQQQEIDGLDSPAQEQDHQQTLFNYVFNDFNFQLTLYIISVACIQIPWVYKLIKANYYHIPRDEFQSWVVSKMIGFIILLMGLIAVIAEDQFGNGWCNFTINLIISTILIIMTIQLTMNRIVIHSFQKHHFIFFFYLMIFFFIILVPFTLFDITQDYQIFNRFFSSIPILLSYTLVRGAIEYRQNTIGEFFRSTSSSSLDNSNKILSLFFKISLVVEGILFTCFLFKIPDQRFYDDIFITTMTSFKIISKIIIILSIYCVLYWKICKSKSYPDFRDGSLNGFNGLTNNDHVLHDDENNDYFDKNVVSIEKFYIVNPDSV